MYRILYRFLVPGWSAKPLVSAHDRIMGTHTLVVGWMGSQRNVPSNGSQAKSGSAWMR